jgi:hypothetical protein
MKIIFNQLISDTCLRIRNFLLKKILNFKNQNSNSQILKQNLLKYESFNHFLKKYHIQYFEEVSNLPSNL